MPVPLIAPRAGQDQVLDVRRQGQRHRTLDRVGAGARRLDDPVAGIVHDVKVVAQAAGQGVGTGPAIQRVIADAAGEGVGEGVAHADEGAGSGEGEILDVCRQGEACQIRLDRVGPGVRRFRHRVVGPHDVGVVAGAADENVQDGVGAAIQRVVSGPAGRGCSLRRCRSARWRARCRCR